MYVHKLYFTQIQICLLAGVNNTMYTPTPTFLSVNLKPTGICFWFSVYIHYFRNMKAFVEWCDVLIRQVTEFMFQNIYLMETGKEHQKGGSLWWHTCCTLYKYILCSHLNIVIANCLSGVQYQCILKKGNSILQTSKKQIPLYWTGGLIFCVYNFIKIHL